MTEKSILQVYDLIGLHHSQSMITLMANLKNIKSFADKLNAIEQEFLMVTGDHDEDYPEVEPDPICLVSRFGSTTEQYVEQFREALKVVSIHHSAPALQIDYELLKSRDEALSNAAQGLLNWAESQICPHEETHRGGVKWEICNSCDAKWYDDDGGKPEFAYPKAVQNAYAVLHSQLYKA